MRPARPRRSYPYVLPFGTAAAQELGATGGKGASLARLTQALGPRGIAVPTGFCLSSSAYWKFVSENKLEGVISREIKAYRTGGTPLAQAGRNIRRAFLKAKVPEEVFLPLEAAYFSLCNALGQTNLAVAVRSSATAEDLPHASFAGQHDSFLHVVGARNVAQAVRACFASAFNDRAIAYRAENKIDHLNLALCVCVQQMVRADRGAAGVIFTTDTESGFPGLIRIEGVWGLGDGIVQGRITPDSFAIFKPLVGRKGVVPIIGRQRGEKAMRIVYRRDGGVKDSPVPAAMRRRFVLSDKELLQLARWAVEIEKLYGVPMDIEWAKDGPKGGLYIVQARPETVHSRERDTALTTYRVIRKGRRLLTGTAVGDGAASGRVHHVTSPVDAKGFPDGGILVARETDPDWVPIMRRAAAVVTERGGRTSHAAIVSREFGIPAVIGAPKATKILRQGQPATVSCCEGSIGYVYSGLARIQTDQVDLSKVRKTRTEVMLNVANPSAALRWWKLPSDGVGLARMEFIIAEQIKVHPLALTRYRSLPASLKRAVDLVTAGAKDKSEYFVDRLSQGIAQIAAPHYPKPVIVRFSDFKTNEYAKLIGGGPFEPAEENPMLGWRGASRYYSPDYRDGFALECRAIARVREQMGLDNVIVMIPFCRTTTEADRVLAEMARNGLRRGKHGLRVYVMCEIPSNVILADEFAKRFDGFSIGSNDLTQLTLGVDRDSHRLADLFTERDPAVMRLIQDVIKTARKKKRKIGLCGQAPSDHPAYAQFLVKAGINSISVTPDSFVKVKAAVAAAERPRKRRIVT